jgi:hypothetical protein
VCHDRHISNIATNRHQNLILYYVFSRRIKDVRHKRPSKETSVILAMFLDLFIRRRLYTFETTSTSCRNCAIRHVNRRDTSALCADMHSSVYSDSERMLNCATEHAKYFDFAVTHALLHSCPPYAPLTDENWAIWHAKQPNQRASRAELHSSRSISRCIEFSAIVLLAFEEFRG